MGEKFYYQKWLTSLIISLYLIYNCTLENQRKYIAVRIAPSEDFKSFLFKILKTKKECECLLHYVGIQSNENIVETPTLEYTIKYLYIWVEFFLNDILIFPLLNLRCVFVCFSMSALAYMTVMMFKHCYFFVVLLALLLSVNHLLTLCL